ncbi:MAG: hypothetical protein JW956_01600 [Calditrichaceae bacterium]|nr:hypothetical protein [Calditrichaceae bacterium]
MQIFCLNNEFTSDAVKYTISYLLDRNGLFFKWINNPGEMDENSILLIYKPNIVQTSISAPALFLSKQFNLDQLHSSNCLWEKVTFKNVSIPIITNSGQQKFTNSNVSASSFDLIANVYYHLARVEENDYQHPNDIDTKAENSILFMHGNFLIPVVDILCDFFYDMINKKAADNNLILIKKALYPIGQEFGIALTHDVDFIRAFHPFKKLIFKALIRSGLKKERTLEEIDKLDELTWGFNRLLPFYKQNNLRATFFFMAKYLEGMHFRYRIASKRIKKLIAQLKSEDHEIAFHPSRYTFESPKRYLKEKMKLEKISGLSVTGIRHHYLRCLFPQIWVTAAWLNLKYEAGMIHRRYSGFRAGTCFPFKTFDHTNQTPLEIIEFPTTFFENTLPDKGNDFEASKKIINQLLETVKAYGGLLNILWHSNNIYQPEVYSKLWDYIIRLIQNENVYNHPLITHYNWLKLREKIRIQSFKQSENGIMIRMVIPDGLEKFSLHVPAKFTYKCSSKMYFDSNKDILTIDCENTGGLISIEALPI